MKVQVMTDFDEVETLEPYPAGTFSGVPEVDINESIINKLQNSWEVYRDATIDFRKAYEEALENERHKEYYRKEVEKLLKGRPVNEVFPICCYWRH